MKKISQKNITVLLTTIFILLNNYLFGQDYSFDWVNTYGGLKSDAAKSICTDRHGNVFITGYFQDSVSFENTVLKSKGDTDIFLVKLSDKGELLWVKQAGGDFRKNMIMTESGKAIATDYKNNIYLTGIFATSAQFEDTIIRSNGGNDIFIAKYKTSGKLLWAKNYGSIGHDLVYDLELDYTNNILITGDIYEKANIGDLKGPDKGSSAFLAKLTNDGKSIWLRTLQGTGHLFGKTITSDFEGNTYWGVNFRNKLNRSNNIIESYGNYDFIIEKVNQSGSVIWFNHFCGKGNNKISSIGINNLNDLYITGHFSNTITLEDKNLTSKGNNDVFVAKINQKGKVIWINNFGGTGSDKGKSLFIKNDSTVIISGEFQDKVMFKNESITADGHTDVFIAVVNGDTKNNLILSFGDISQQKINSLICNNDNNILLTGSFRKSFTFGSEYVLATGSDDIFVAKLNTGEGKNYQIQANSQYAQSSEKLKIQVIPNPTTGKIDIYILGFLNELTDINIKDMFGKTVFSKNGITENHFSVDLSGHTKGIYLLTVKTKDKTFTEKIIKQ